MKTNENMRINEQIAGSEKLNGNLIDMDSLINKVKAEDGYNLRIAKSFMWILWGLIFLYLFMMIINIMADRGLYRTLSQLFFMLSFISFVLIFRANYRIFKKIDYSLPVKEMLQEVVKRYQLRLSIYFILLIPIILMDAGLTLTFYDDLLPMSPLNRVLIVQAFYIPIMTISALIGAFIWRKKQKPLRDRAREFLKDIES